MSRAPKIAIVAAVSALAVVLVLLVAVLVLVRTPWFRNTARRRVIASIEEATGGRAEMGGFAFSPGTFTADITGFVLHGTEPPGAPPLFRADSMRVALKPGAALQLKLEVQSFYIERPQVYVRVAPDGSTNLPRPTSAPAPQGQQAPLKTIMSVGIERFQAAHGVLVVADRKIPLNLHGENVNAQLIYHAVPARYTGGISASPVQVGSDGNPPLPLNVDVPLEVTEDALTITNARFEAPVSRLQASGRFTDLTAPQGSFRLSGRLALPELARSFQPSLLLKTLGTPPVGVNAAASIEGGQAKLESLNLVMGGSSLEASGALANLQSFTGRFQFSGDFTMEELKNLLNLPSLGTGTVHVAGTATTGRNGVDVKARFGAGNVTLNAGTASLSGVSVSSDVHVASGRVALSNLRVGALGGTFQGSAEIINNNRFVAGGTLHGIELKQAAAAYGVSQSAWTGTVSGPVRAEGSLRGPLASQLLAAAKLAIAPQPGGIPVSGRLDAAYNGPRDSLIFGNSFLALPSTRVDFSGSSGNRLNIRADSRNLNDLLPVLAVVSNNPPQKLPVELANGEAILVGTVAGSTRDPRITGRLSITNFVVNGQTFDHFTAGLALASTGAAIRNAVLRQRQLEAHFDASIGLVNWKPQPASPVAAIASVRNAKVESLLAAFGRPAPGMSGLLFADANLSGTYGDPRAAIAVRVNGGTFYGEPFDAAQAGAAYSAAALQLTSAQVTAPSGRLQASGQYRHPPGQFGTGRIEFHIASSPLELSRIRALSARAPGFSGVVELRADGAGTLNLPNAPLPFKLSSLDAKLAAGSLTINRQPVGRLVLTAETRGPNLALDLRSDLAGSDIRGSGTWQLAGDYPIQASLTFSPVELGAVARLASVASRSIPGGIEGMVAGGVTISGPAFRPADLTGTLQLTQLELRPPARVQPPYLLRNAGTIVATLGQSVLRLQPARLVGPSTGLTLAGAMYLNKGNALDLRASGRIGLELAQSLSPDLTSTGAILLNAALHGTLSKPDVNGRLDLQNVSLKVTDFPNGISNANGVILFSGTQAVIQRITGETGGGKVSIDGTVHYAAPVMDFSLQAKAEEVRIDYPENVSTKVNATLGLAGTTNSSVLSGDISALEIVLRTNTDIGALLAPGGPPPTAPVAQKGLLGGMRLDVRIATAPDIQFFTALAQNLQASGSVLLRGTPTRPGMLGHFNITEGEILFFGNRYTVNRGTISFFNPQRIEPVLNVGLETKAKGIIVTVMISGPVDHLKLTYSSDPPLLFSDIVGLLATGRTPTTDPVLAASQSATTLQQGFQQMGASAILGQAIATPVAGRLQRLFGISQLQINPQIVGTSNTPQTQVTIEQQVSRSFSFTYIQNLSEASPQAIRLEWAIDPQWSAVGVRELDGRFGVDLYYRKSFK